MKLLFKGGNQFVLDGVAVGADVGRVHRVRVVVVRIRVLNFYDKHSRKSGRNPSLIEPVGFFLMKAVAEVRLKVGVGRSGAKVIEVGGKVIVKDHEWKTRIGVVVKTLGNENDGAEKHGPSPELC